MATGETAGISADDSLSKPVPKKHQGKHLEVFRDYGQLANSATKPRAILASNGSKYLIKGPRLSPELPHVAANEFIVANLANRLGLPILDHRIIAYEDGLVFGSTLMPKGSFYDNTTEERFERCCNKDKVYELVAFDTWLAHRDRHYENLIVRIVQGEGGAPDTHFLLFNDHSECPLRSGLDHRDLGCMLAVPLSQCVCLDFVKQAIADVSRLDEAIKQIESLADEDIVEVVKSTPAEWLGEDEVTSIGDFLCQRKTKLRDLIKAGRNCFTNLGSGDL